MRHYPNLIHFVITKTTNTFNNLKMSMKFFAGSEQRGRRSFSEDCRTQHLHFVPPGETLLNFGFYCDLIVNCKLLL